MTTTPLDLARLRAIEARLERATGPDRELDWLIAEAFGEVPDHIVVETGTHYVWARRKDEFSLWKALDSEGRNCTYWVPEPRSRSIDAADALRRRVLPGSVLILAEMRKGVRGSYATVYWQSSQAFGWPDIVGDCEPVAGNRRTLPLAIILATIRALIAREEGR